MKNKTWEESGYKTYLYIDKNKVPRKFLARSDEDAELYRKKVGAVTPEIVGNLCLILEQSKPQ